MTVKSGFPCHIKGIIISPEIKHLKTAVTIAGCTRIVFLHKLIQHRILHILLLIQIINFHARPIIRIKCQQIIMNLKVTKSSICCKNLCDSLIFFHLINICSIICQKYFSVVRNTHLTGLLSRFQ